MSKNKTYTFDESFYNLANSVAKALKRNNALGDSKKLKSLQKKQVETLMRLENDFKKSILKFAQSREIYKRFILFIVVENKNILSARPYFREGAVTFSKKITPELQEANVAMLQKFNINFKFIQFIRENWLGKFPKTSEKLYAQIEKTRTELIENNLPLAINEAKRFYNKVPNNPNVTLIDLIAAAAEGLGSGIDKWTGKYTPVFRSVCIGRMKGNMVDMYSETTVHFYPTDKRILYKANTIRFRSETKSIKELAEAINKSFEQDEKDGKKNSKERVTESQLNELLNAASTFSADQPIETDGETGREITLLDLTPDNSSFEEKFINNVILNKTITMAAETDILTKKILKLKGLEV